MISKKAWATVLGGFAVALIFTLSVTTLGKSAISEMAGLAVAQSASKWNSVKDGSQGDGLTSGVMASATYLYNGLTFDRMRSAGASDGASATGLLTGTVLGYNGSTYDRLRSSLAADASAVTGLLNNAQMVFNGSTYDRVREATADSSAATGIITSGNMIFNASTWDRMRTASGDNLAATGIHAAGNMGFDGSTWDRTTSISNTNNIATTSQGVRYSTPISTWTVVNTVSAATTAASASKASGGGTVRHVATGITICYVDTAIATAPVLVHLRDGATGAGTIIRSWLMSVPVAGQTQCESVTGLNMSGSAATAMTLEFAAATAATSSKTVTLTGYSTP